VCVDTCTLHAPHSYLESSNSVSVIWCCIVLHGNAASDRKRERLHICLCDKYMCDSSGCSSNIMHERVKVGLKFHLVSHGSCLLHSKDLRSLKLCKLAYMCAQSASLAYALLQLWLVLHELLCTNRAMLCTTSNITSRASA
jgi:hypothetical protein